MKLLRIIKRIISVPTGDLLNMSKLTKIISLILWMPLSVIAQENKDCKWSITPRVGITIPSYTKAVAQDLKWWTVVDDNKNLNTNLGLNAGLDIEYRYSNHTGWSLGLYYSSHPVKMPGLIYRYVQEDTEIREISNYSMNLQYLDIPILFNYHVKGMFVIKSGLQLGIRMKAKAKMDDYVHLEKLGNVDTTTVLSYSLSSLYKPFRLSVPVGISYSYKNMEVDIRYVIGISNINKKVHFREDYLMVTLGYCFPDIKRWIKW